MTDTTRISLSLGTAVLSEAKRRATEEGRTLSALVEAALLRDLEETREVAFLPDHLAPYVSIIPLDTTAEFDPKNTELRERFTLDLRGLIEDSATPANLLGRIGPVEEQLRRGWYVLGWWYGMERSPPWIARSDNRESAPPIVLRDIIHHLVLLLLGRLHNSGFVVAVGTRPTLQRQLVRHLTTKYRNPAGEPLLTPVPRDDAARAFLRGNAHQVALFGLHRPIESKADAKTLAGPDLRQAIDPFGDQSFRLDAALSDIESARILADFRGRLPEGSPLRELDPEDAIGSASGAVRRRLVGLSFKDGRIWTRATRKMSQFLDEAESLCHLIAHARESTDAKSYGFEQRGYDALTRDTAIRSPDELGCPLDFDLRLPLPGAPDEARLGPEALLANEQWLARGEFRLDHQDGPRLFVEALYDGRRIALLRVQPVVGLARGIDYSLTLKTEERYGADPALEILDRVLSQFSERAVLWFDNGYALQAGRAYRPRYRDVPFDGWRWLALEEGGRTYRADLEKPIEVIPDPTPDEPKKTKTRQKRLWEHGWDSDSLFDFVVQQAERLFDCAGREWHLLSDDRSGELADFVFVEPQARRMALVHVKAAGSADSPSIAPAKYEVVVSQATKNLRFLDPDILVDQLVASKGTPIERVTWKNGTQVRHRGKFVEALKAIGAFPNKEVIVFQPHTTRQSWENAQSALRETGVSPGDPQMSPGDRIQLLRLKTLLADLEVACRRVGASLAVWGRDLEPQKAEPAPPSSSTRAV